MTKKLTREELLDALVILQDRCESPGAVGRAITAVQRELAFAAAAATPHAFNPYGFSDDCRVCCEKFGHPIHGEGAC